MNCCVPFCKELREEQSISDSKLQPVSFHEFPNTDWLRNSWLLAFEMNESDLSEGALVCSKHFHADNFYVTGSGLMKLRSKAIPLRCKRKIVSLDLQVCLICLDTTNTIKMSPMCEYNLTEAYINVTGLSMSRIQKFKCEPRLCVECAHRLLKCFKFRDKCLVAHELLSQITQDKGMLTGTKIKTINRDENNLTSNIVKHIIETNHCDLYVLKDDVELNIDDSEQYDKIKIERNDPKDPDVKDETLSVYSDLESNCISGLDASQVTNDDKRINNENMKRGDAIYQDKPRDPKLTSNLSVDYDVLEYDTEEENLDFDIDDEGEYINEDNDSEMDIEELKYDDTFTNEESIDDDNNRVKLLLDQKEINSSYKAHVKQNVDSTKLRDDNTINSLMVYNDEFKNRYSISNVRTLSQTQEHAKIENKKNEGFRMTENPDSNNVISENNLIINNYETNANIHSKVDGCDDNDVNMEFVNDYNDYITFLNENKSTEITINNNGVTSNKVYHHSSDKVSLTNVILVKAKTSKPQIKSNKNNLPKSVKVSMSIKKNQLNKQQVALEKVNHPNNDEISLINAKLGKDKLRINNSKRVKDEVSLNNTELVKDKVSSNNTELVKDKVSSNNTKLVKDKVSSNNTELVKDKVSSNNTELVKDKVSSNNTELVKDKVSSNNTELVKD
ncbi:jg73, partial [Pararge aegeria aegeria]